MKRKTAPPGTSPKLLWELLEPRILYSAAPAAVAEGEIPDTEASEAADVAGTMPAGTPEGSLLPPSTHPDVIELEAALPGGLAADGLAGEDLADLAEAAVSRWTASGLRADQVEVLLAAEYEIRDLGGLTVAYAEGGRIVLDDDAGGRGWFVDRTPGADEEFAPSGPETSRDGLSAEALGGIDLLTVLMHEQGHLLGLDDLYLAEAMGDLMHGGIGEGVRRLPVAGQAAWAEAGSVGHRAPASLLVTTFDDVVDAGDGVLSLREAISQAVDGDIIVLGAGTYEMQLTASNENANAGGDFDINNKDITIQGAGLDVTFVDGNGLDRVFQVQGGANVTFRDLTVTGGKLNYGHGAGMQVDGTSTVVHLENVRLGGNTVETPNVANTDRFGGGIRVNNSTVTGVNVHITDNSAVRVGAGRSPLGAGLMLDGTAVVSLTDSVISNNINTHSSGGGAYVAFGSTLNLDGVTMAGNQAVTGGGIFGAYGAVISLRNSAATQTVLTGNQAVNASLGANTSTYGGAIRVDGATLTITGDTVRGDVLIQDNTSFVTNFGTTGFGVAYAGGLSLRTEAQVTLDRVTISGNTADNVASNQGEGGGLFIEQTGTVVNATNVTIENNTARVRGGGFRVANPGVVVTLTDSVVRTNTAQNEYGGGFSNNGTLNLVNTDVQGNMTLDLDNVNRRDGHGGGFYNGAGGILTFDATSDVRGNSAYGYGGGGFNDQGVIHAHGNVWEQNQTIHFNSGRNGGALWNYLGGVANLADVTFQDNATGASPTQIEGSGGAIYNSDQAVVNITGASVFQRNLAASGGAISNVSNGSLVSITGTAGANALIQDNWVRADGGGLRQDSELARMELRHVTIRNNIAEASDGGGIANHNGIQRGDHVTIHNNAAGFADGHDGGGIYAVNRSDVVFTHSVISNNAAGDDGGGVFVATVPVQVVFGNSVISGNRTGIDHRNNPGEYVDRPNTIGNVTVLGDVTKAANSTHTGADGGGIYGVERANITLIDTSVTDNISSGVGGGVLVTNDAQLSVRGSLIRGNRAGFNSDGTVSSVNRHGGGLYVAERVLFTMDGSVVKDNETSGQGGGLYHIGDSNIRISGSTFEGNLAGREGGGVFQTNANTRSRIVNSTFTGNQAGVFSDPYVIVNYDTETAGDVASDLAVGQTVTTATGSGVIVARVQNTNSTTSGIILLSGVTGTFTDNQLLDNGLGTTALVNGTGALGDGGGVYVGDGIMDLIHATVAGNTATDAGGGVRRNGGIVNFLNSVASNNTGRTAALADLDGTIAATTSFEGTATLTVATGATVGAALAGGAGTTTVQDTVTIFNPDAGDANIVGAVTTELLASDQNGGGRGGSAAPSDRGAIELNPLASAITLDSLTAPATWISGTPIDVSAVAGSSGTGGGTLRFSWSVTGGSSAVPPENHDVASPGLGEEDGFRFTHTVSSVETASEILTVTVTITDLTTGQTVTDSRTVRVLNPDAMPTTPTTSIVVTTAADVIDGGDGVTSLREAITAANSSPAGDVVITFDAGLDLTAIVTTISGAADDGNAREDYDLTKSNGAVFIKGNGVAETIIDGGGLDRVFDIRPNATVFFRDLTITGGVTVDVDHGAGFRALGSTVVLHNVDLSGNQSTRGTTNVGGGFYVTNNGIVGGTVVMKGGSIRGNIAGGHGGGFYASGNLASTTSVFLEDVTIAGNTSINEGTTIDQDGGGFYFTGQKNVLQLKNVVIADNAARDDGGGFFIAGEYQMATFDNVTIQRNVVEGAVQDNDPGTSFNAVAFNNATNAGADGGGGVIETTNSTITFLGGLIGGGRNPDGTIKDGNYADNNGAGVAIKGASTVIFNNTTIRGNFAEDSGGGLSVEGPSTVTFNGGTISENFAIDEQGGGVAVFGGVFHGNNASITGNRAGDRIYNADPGDRVGGAFYVTNGAKVNLEDVILTGNQAEGRGGAIYGDRASVVTITSSVADTKTSVLSGNTTVENNASRGGAAVWLTHAGTTLNLTDVTVADNRSADDGGAIFLQGASSAHLTRVDLAGNEAQNQGGAIFLESDQSTVNLVDVVISGNATRVSHGGGISAAGTVTATNVVIRDNRTGFDLDTGPVAGGSNDFVGGGVYLNGAESAFIGSGVVILGNQTYGRGGGVFVADGRLELTDFIVRDNQTNSDGNTDRGRGGGIYSETFGTVLLTNGEVSGNRAEGHGGGLYQASDGSRMELTNVTVSGNRAGYDPDVSGLAVRASDGGGIHSTSNSTLVLDHVTVAGNEATQNGGGVHRGGGSIVYRNSILAGNIANAESTSAADPAFRSDNNGDATLEGAVIILANQGGTLTNPERRILADPQLGALADNHGPLIGTAGSTFVSRTHAILSNSVAAGAAAGSSVTEDQRGVERPAGSADLGAYELGTAGTVSLANVDASPLSLGEGELVTVTGDIGHALGDHPLGGDAYLTIDWGDGSEPYRQSFAAGTDLSALGDFSVDHAYLFGGDGHHVLRVLLADLRSGSPVAQVSFTVTVSDDGGVLVVPDLTATTTEDAPVTIRPFDPNPPTVIRTGDLLLPDSTTLSGGNRMGWAVAIDGDLAVVGSEGQSNLEEVYVYRRNSVSGAWELEQTLFNDSTAQFDDFGYAVAVDAANGRLFVGAQLDDSGGNDKGAVYYYEFDAGQPAGSRWVLRQKIQATVGSNDSDQFGSALAVSGGVLAIGALAEDADSPTDQADVAGADNSGAVYVFTHDAGSNQFVLAQKIKARTTAGGTDVGANDNFGVSVALDETASRLVVGAELNDDTGANSGSAYVYRFESGNPTGSQWVIEQKLSSPSENGDDRFGWRLDISGDTIVVGARQDDTGGTNRGAAFVFTRSGTTWTAAQTLGSGTTGVSDSDLFGGSVAVDGNRLLVGAYLDDLTGKSNVGRAYLFERADAASPFVFVKHLDSADGAGGDQFGLGVALSGDRYLVGARLADATVTVDSSTTYRISQWGAAYVFEGAGSAAAQVAKLDGDVDDKTDVPAKVEFGRRVAIRGDFAIVGAPRSGKDPGGDDERTGRAYLYQRDDHGNEDPADDTWTLIATLAPPTTDDDFDDFNGFAVDVSEDGSVAVVGALFHETAGSNRGAVYVYERDPSGNGYELRGRVRPANVTDGDEFGRKVALSEDGRTLVVGMRLDDDRASNSGSVHVYDVTGSDWTAFFAAGIVEQSIPSVNSDGIKLKPISDRTTTATDEFGMAVAISGNRIAVGAWGDDLPDDNNAGNPSRDRGSAYLFERDASNLHALLDPFVDRAQIAVRATSASGINQVQIVAGSGLSVAQAGTVVTVTLGTGGSDAASVVAAINGAGIAGFSAELFLENGAAATPNDGSGVITQPLTADLNAWRLVQKLAASNQGQDDRFGRSLDLAGDVLVVGAYLEDSNTEVADNGNAGDSGSAYVFEFNGSRWVETQRLKASDPSGSDQFGFNVAVDGDVIVVGAWLEDTAGRDGGSVYVYRRDAARATGSEWQQTDLIRSPQGSTDDQFGISVDVSDQTVVVGAVQATRTLADGTRQVHFGAAYTYHLADPAASGLTDLGELRLPDGTTLSRANQIGWAVAIDGDLAVVGSEGQSAQEEVYVYRFNAGTGAWDLEQTLLNPAALAAGVDPEQFDDFGSAVAVHAATGRLFVGAHLEDAGGTDKGRVYFYEYNPGTSRWELKQHITDGDTGDDFGYALSTNGGTLAVSARLEDSDTEDPADTGGANDSGAVWVYSYNAGTGQFDRLQKLKARIDASTLDVQGGDQFGASVAIDGDTIVVGQELEDGAGTNAGAAYVYVFNAGTGVYEIQQKLQAGDAAADDRFGFSVDISGDTIVAGSRLEDTGGSNTGSVYVFTRSGGVWTQVQQIGDAASTAISDEDQFGGSVAVDGNRLLVSGHLDDARADNAGKVWVFERADASSPFVLVNELVAEDGAAYDEFGLNVAISGDRYLIGARLANARIDVGNESLTIDRWGAAYVFEGGGASISQVRKLDGDVENKAEIGGFFEYGRRVSVSGDYAVVGAPRMGKDGGIYDESTGRAYVFRRNDGGTADPGDDGWSLVATLAPPVTDDDFDDFFGFGVSVSEDGSTVAVGALFHEAGGSNQGAVYVFQWNAATEGYDLQGRIRAANRNDGDEFGRQVALNEDGSVLAVGSWLDDDVATNAGAVHVYDRGSGWGDFFAGAPLQQSIPAVDSDGVKLQAATPEAEARLGRSLAVSGTTIVAGAYLQNLTGANDAGAAFVFSHNGSTWVQTAELNASDFGTSDQFGLDVDIDGNTIVVGAFAEDSNTDGTGNTIGDSGAAYVFEFDGSNWVETRKLKAQDASASDQFGISVAVDGDIVVVGAFLADTVGSDSGSVYVFARGTTATHGTPWAQTQVIHSPFGGVNDQFGRSVDVANGVVIAGAPNADRVLADGTVVKAYGGVHSWQVSPANRGPGSGFTITAVSAPARGSATTDGTTVTFNPGNDFDFLNPGEFVTETFTYTVQVAGGGTATGQITVTVTGKNDSPVAGNDTFSVGEDGPALTGDLLGNDLDDDQNTSLVIVNVNGSVAQVGTGLTLASGAVLTVNADGTFTYDPNGQFESLAQGQTATDTFTYQVTDASGQIIHQAVDGTFVGEAEIFSSRTGQGGNFWEVTGESGPQNVNGYTGSREGSFVQVPEAGGALLPPAPGVQGQPGISYQVEVTEAGTYQLFVRAAGYDGNSDSLYATVLHHGDGASGGAPDWYRVNVPVGGFQWIGSGAPESTNATDPGVAMNFTLGVGIHTIVLSPREDGVAVDSWMLRKSDSPVAAPGATETGPKAQQSATVTITIHGENDAPTATDDTAAAVEAGGIVNGTPGTNPSGNVIAGGIPDSDVDAGTVLAVTAINGSAVGAGTTSADGTVVAGTYGTLTIGADGSYRYVVDQAAAESLAPGDAPTDVFTYTVSDGTATDTATLTVTITGANDAPVITSTATASVAENSTGTILDVQSADPEGLSEGAGLTYLISGGTDAALFTIDPATGALSFRAAPDHENPLDAGADNIYDVQVRVSDGSLSTTQDIAVTVTDVDAVVSIAVLDADRAEGNAGNTPYTFTVTRSGDTSGAASVGYTVSGAADAADFGGSLPSGTVQFADGETSRTLTLDVSGDAAPEADEAFTVTLGSPVAAVIATGSAAGTIRNDDTATADLSVTTQGSESGPTAIVFTVTLDKVNDTGAAITFDLADAGTGTATSGSDYDAIPAGATITVAAGASTGTYTLLVLDDILVEGVETVTATISNSTNPAVGIGTATATADIADADTATVSIAATTDAEEPGTDGRFTVTLSAPSATDTVVRYTVTGTATAGDDYTTLSGSVTIPAGQTTAFIDVSVLDDGIVEGAEDIVVTLDTVISGDFGGRIAVSAAPDNTATVHLASDDTTAGGLPELFGPLANSFRDLGQTDSLFAGLASFDTVNGFGDRYPGVGFGLYEGGPLGTGGGAGLVPVFSGLGAFGWGVQLVVYDRLGFPITSVNATIGESGSWLVALPGVDLSDAAAVQVRITPPYTGYEAVQPTVFGADITGLFGSWMDLFETGQLAAQGDDILGQLLDTEEISD